MIEAMHYTAAGNERDARFTLPSETFDGTVNESALYRAVVAWRNNQRQGTAKTKTRSEISGGNQKPWKQKGTGRARQGTTRAPHWRGGGIVFGPRPRKYTTELPRKMRQLARKSALNARAREGNVAVVEKLMFDAPKTGLLAGLLARVGAAGEKVLVLTHGHNRNVYLSGRNMPAVEVMNYADASAYDILWSDKVVVEEAALTGVEPEITERPDAAAKAPSARPRKKKASAKAAKQPKAAKAAARAPKKKSVKKAKAAPARGKAKSAKRAPKKGGK